jgi:DNA-binding transcriptional MerR regulator/methylmalonyl-CoA mutase cobalamin-binding subunit
VSDTPATPASPPRYRIGAVAHETGIEPETLRVWERRYQVVRPTRTPRGGRLYSEHDVTRLRLIKQLVDRRHAISQVASLDEGQLRALLGRMDGGAEGGDRALPLDDLRGRFLTAVERLDSRVAQQILGRAALLLGPRALVLEMITPLMQEVGDRWAAGIDGICHEHLSSSIVRTVMGGLVATQAAPRGARRLLVATPSGELHELGALAAALLAGSAGWDTLYLGPNLPADEIAEAARRRGADAVAISLVHAPPVPALAAAELERLATVLPPSIALLAGGMKARQSAALVRRAIIFDDLATLDAWLAKEAGHVEG